MSERETPQFDRLLWVSAGIVALIALVSLTLIPFWPSTPSPRAGSSLNSASVESQTAPSNESDAAERAYRLTLRAAAALEEGHLIEPLTGSAWQIYLQALATNPNDAIATAGLNTVADRLIEAIHDDKTRSALAASIVDEILRAIPSHVGALEQRASMVPPSEPEEIVMARSEVPSEIVNDPAKTEITTEPEVARETEATDDSASRVDPIPEIYDRFEASMAAGKLTMPAKDSAKEYVRVMRALSPSHQLTEHAESILFDAIFGEFETSFTATDTDSAAYWLDEAAMLAPAVPAIADGREALTEFIAALGEADMVAASELTPVEAVEPIFPEKELTERVEGWVDLEFTLTRDGYTRDVKVIDASHEASFTNEAAFAVLSSQYEPFTILGKRVEQRVRTRVSFLID